MTCTSLDPNSGQTNPVGGDPCVKFTLHDTDVSSPNTVQLYFQVNQCDNEPKAGIHPEDFIIKEDDTLISKFESVRRLTSFPQRFQLITVLILDMSGSIVNSDDFQMFQQAAKLFIESVALGQSVAIYTFDGRAELQPLVEFTKVITQCNQVDMVGVLTRGIDSLSNYEEIDRSTNLNGAIKEGIVILDQKFRDKGTGTIFSGSLTVFTDGTDQAARVSDAQAVSAAKNSAHSIYTIGLGGEIDKTHLEAIGIDGPFFATDISELESKFADVATEIKASSDSFYLLEYCSPKRAGRHNLKLTIEGYTGEAKFTFNASNFEGGCSISENLEGIDVGVGGKPCINASVIIGDGTCNSNSDCNLNDNCSIGYCQNSQCIIVNICTE